MEHNGHPVEERVLLPASYIATLAFRKKDQAQVMKALPDILHRCQGEILSERIAEHEWKNRFKIMVVKRLGPSLVPAEVVIPLSSLGNFMEEVENKINQPVVKEGTVIRRGKDGKPEIVILGFIPADQRRFNYNFVFSLSLSIMNIAERNGGRAYATGLYFKSKAAKIFGPERLAKLQSFKNKIDGKGIFNPGKVTGFGLLDAAMELGGALEPLIRPLGNNVIAKIGERPGYPLRTFRRMWPGMPIAVRSAAIAWKNATSFTAAAGKARARAASGTGCRNIWKARRNGTSTWWIPSSSAQPANSAISAVRHLCRSSRPG